MAAADVADPLAAKVGEMLERLAVISPKPSVATAATIAPTTAAAMAYLPAVRAALIEIGSRLPLDFLWSGCGFCAIDAPCRRHEPTGCRGVPLSTERLGLLLYGTARLHQAIGSAWSVVVAGKGRCWRDRAVA